MANDDHDFTNDLDDSADNRRACKLLHDELIGVIRRYSLESDIGFCEALGVLVMVKDDLMSLARGEAGVSDVVEEGE